MIKHKVFRKLHLTDLKHYKNKYAKFQISIILDKIAKREN